MIPLRHFVTASLLCTMACSKPSATSAQRGPADALLVSKEYAESHYPKGTFQPGGAPLQYFVEDAGDVWNTEIGRVGYLGGGLHMVVRKQDMKVVSALRTQ
jgi:hypothetical protein